jgi:hypothetical protein
MVDMAHPVGWVQCGDYARSEMEILLGRILRREAVRDGDVKVIDLDSGEIIIGPTGIKIGSKHKMATKGSQLFEVQR